MGVDFGLLLDMIFYISSKTLMWIISFVFERELSFLRRLVSLWNKFGDYFGPSKSRDGSLYVYIQNTEGELLINVEVLSFLPLGLVRTRKEKSGPCRGGIQILFRHREGRQWHKNNNGKRNRECNESHLT